MKKSLLTLTILAMAASTQAAVISADSYLTGGSNYTVGGLNTQNVSATGFSGAYTADANFSVNATGLTYTNAASSNGTLTTAGGAITFGPTTSTTNVNAIRAASNPGTSPLYASFLVRSEANSMTGSSALLNLGGVRVAGMLNGNVFGYSNGSETQGSAFAANKTYLFVLKITPNASGTIDYLNTWYFNTDSTQDLSIVDPTLGANSSIAGSFVSNNSTTGPNIITGAGIWQGTGGVIGLQARGQASGWTTGNLIMDELKIGNTWGDVVAVPEPTTWALLAGSLTALMVFRRRRA